MCSVHETFSISNLDLVIPQMKQTSVTSASMSPAIDLLSENESMMIPKKMFMRIMLMIKKKVKSNQYLNQ